MMWAGVNWLLLFFFVPETYAPVLLRRKARKLRKETGNERFRAPIEMMNKSVTKTVMWSCVRPFQLLVLEVSYQASDQYGFVGWWLTCGQADVPQSLHPVGYSARCLVPVFWCKC